jgi:hypothetical protein
MIAGHVLERDLPRRVHRARRAELSAPTPLEVYGVQLAGEHGGLAVTVEVVS